MSTSTRRFAALVAALMLAFLVPARGPFAAADISSGYDVRILRDRWGVPHVFGTKDTDAAFGLAYAHAEDDFKTMQLVMMAVGGRLASVLGPKGAGNDYLVHLIRLWDTVNARYETDLDPRTRALCEAYADGVNRYAALHPRETLPGLGRVTGKHIVAGFVHKMPLMVGVDGVLKELFESRRPRRRGRSTPCSPRPSGMTRPPASGRASVRTQSRCRPGGAPAAKRCWPSIRTSRGRGPSPGTRPTCTARRDGT